MDEFAERLWQQAASGLTALFRSASRFEAQLSHAGARVMSGEPNLWLNWLFVESGEAAAATLRDHAAALAERRLPGLIFVPEADSAPLAPFAAELGLVDGGVSPWMVCRTDRRFQVTSNWAVERVRDPDTLRDALAVVADVFDMPRDATTSAIPPAALVDAALDIYAARLAGRVVGAGACTYDGAAAGIWAMATLPQHQRQGAGRAILEHMIVAGLARGATTFFLEASEEGKHLYDTFGFRTVLESQVWLAGLDGVPTAH